MKRRTVTVSVSMPAKTLRAVDAARQRLGRSRSSVVAEALEAWLARRGGDERDRAYLEGYARIPDADDTDVASAAVATWEAWDGTPRRD